MSLEGSIKDFGLSDIFQLIYVQQKSGLMTIDNQSHQATVGFVKGMVVSAQLEKGEGTERIGDVLVRAKRITPRQLETALKIQEDRGEFLGQILVSEGILNPEDLKRALKLQTLEAVYRLFRWKEGRYRFEQQQVSYPKDYVEPISTEHILMEGVRRLDEWPYIEKKIPSLSMIFAPVPERQGEIDQAAEPAPTAPSPASDDPLAGLDPEPEGRFSQAEVAVYRAVNGTHPVSRIIELVQLGEFEVCKGLANLLTAGLIVPVSVPEVAVERGDRWAGYGRVRAGVLSAFWWTANLLFVGAFVAALVWWGWQTKDRFLSLLDREMQPLQVIMLPHHLKGFDELMRVWRVDHGRPARSVFEALSEYGAASWPLSDPWGKSWIYDPISDTVFASTRLTEHE